MGEVSDRWETDAHTRDEALAFSATYLSFTAKSELLHRLTEPSDSSFAMKLLTTVYFILALSAPVWACAVG
ncbi:hypothetical protein N7467_011027 [Penicillium canescens]|nr:hypothetical protein N7467_011027 [Penicillium canescens]